MRRSLTALLTVLFLGLDLQAYPVIETNPSTVRPNAWTMQLPTAKVRANQQGLPVLVAIVDSVTCSLCKSFDQLVLQQGSWSSFISQYPMFLVMLDRSKLTSAEWQSLPAPYRSGSGGLDFPTIAVHAPNGTKLTQFVATGGYGVNP
ncbi:MAG: hypothetical protein PHV28_19335, partial [Kiritimatiellae bacterium]|nr:hypothetical protein [Kiritimatiellia bacterium]